MPVTRPRRALLEEPEDTEPVVRYIPRRSSGPAAMAEPASLESAEDTDEVKEPASHPRRALPVLPDLPDTEDLGESRSLGRRSPDPIPEDSGDLRREPEPDDGPPTVVPPSKQNRAVSPMPPLQESAFPASPESNDQPRPARALIEASRQARMLVVGSRGFGGFGELVLGSVSHHVVSYAKCSVVVVR